MLTQGLVHREGHLAAAQDGYCWPLHCQRGAARVHEGSACPIKCLLPAERSCIRCETSMEAALQAEPA